MLVNAGCKFTHKMFKNINFTTRPWDCELQDTRCSRTLPSLQLKRQAIYIKSNIVALWGHAVAQLVEALLYKSEGRGFDSQWCHWNFSLT